MRASRGFAVLLALLLVPFAGCVLPTATEPIPPAEALAGLSEERFGALAGESVWIDASSDGEPLHVRLFRPDAASDAAWKSPVILVMSPYFGYDARADMADASSRPTYFRYQWLLDNFVPRGYTVAFQDVRGTGDSGGCLEQTAQLQWQDAYDVVEWLGTQEWSNGKVGTFGKSYDAETQQSAAVMAPPHLVTIVPVASVSGQYEYSFYDGVPFTAQAAASNGGYMTSDGLQAPTTPEGLAAFPSRPGCHVEMMRQGLDMSGDWNEFWEDREIRHHVEKVEASVLYVHGLQDWNVKPVAIRDWFDRIPSEKRAILGQWAHDYPEENRWNKDWSRTDWRATVHKWYDYWLLDLDNGILDELPPVQVQDNAGVWRREATFPPTDATPLVLHFGDGTLTREPTAFDPLPMRENEEGFARSVTGLPIPTVPPPLAPPNEELVFESEALAQTLHVSGWPTIAMNFTVTETASGRTDPHFAFVLYDVEPGGQATWINRGYLSARHRAGVDDPQPVPVGETIQYEIRFFPGDVVLGAGHSLRLVLSGSDDWTQPEGSFWAGAVVDGFLSLPVIERDWDAVTLDVEFGPPVSS